MTKAKTTKPKATKRAAPKAKAAPKQKKAKVASAENNEERQKTKDNGREADGRWKKGFVPNPGGRPGGIGDLRKLAREHTHSALNTLVSIMEDAQAPRAARVTAASVILDRGYGKPVQQLEVGRPGDFSEMSEAEVDAFIGKASMELSAYASMNPEYVHAMH